MQLRRFRGEFGLKIRIQCDRAAGGHADYGCALPKYAEVDIQTHCVGKPEIGADAQVRGSFIEGNRRVERANLGTRIGHATDIKGRGLLADQFDLIFVGKYAGSQPERTHRCAQICCRVKCIQIQFGIVIDTGFSGGGVISIFVQPGAEIQYWGRPPGRFKADTQGAAFRAKP